MPWEGDGYDGEGGLRVSRGSLSPAILRRRQWRPSQDRPGPFHVAMGSEVAGHETPDIGDVVSPEDKQYVKI